MICRGGMMTILLLLAIGLRRLNCLRSLVCLAFGDMFADLMAKIDDLRRIQIAAIVGVNTLKDLLREGRDNVVFGLNQGLQFIYRNRLILVRVEFLKKVTDVNAKVSEYLNDVLHRENVKWVPE
jgi:hypothetical protein